MCCSMLLSMRGNFTWPRDDNGRSLPAEHSDSQDVMLCTLASSQCLTQDICETKNYVVLVCCTNKPMVSNNFWMNAFLHDYDYTTHVCKSDGVWFRQCRTWQGVHRHHPTSIFQQVASGSRLTTTFHRPSSSSVFCPPSSGFHLTSPASYRTVACYFLFAAARLRFSSSPLDNSQYTVVKLQPVLLCKCNKSHKTKM